MMMGGMITCDENDKATTVPNSKRQREFFLETEKVFLSLSLFFVRVGFGNR